MTTPMSLQPWSWQVFILIQLWWQFFQMFVYGEVVYAQTWYWPWKLTACIEPPSYASTAFVVVIWPSFLFDSLVKIWATCEIFFEQMVYCPSSWQKISRTVMNHRTANVARTPSIKWELNSNWLTAGKECGSILSSRLWGGALRDDTKNGCAADYLIIGN